MLTDDNLSFWITSKAQDEVTRIKHHEVQQNKHDSGVSNSTEYRRDYPVNHSLSNDLKGFAKWYQELVQGIHPLTNEKLDRIAESHFN